MKDKVLKNISTFLDIYKMFGEDIAIAWLDKELDKLDKKQD